MNTARLNQGTPLLLNAVSKHYAENIVLNQLDLHIPAGQFVAVVGRSGGGKSTLLRLLAGLETPTAGDVLAGTTPLAEIQEDTRMMFQDARLLPWKSVIDNVGLGLKGQWPRCRASGVGCSRTGESRRGMACRTFWRAETACGAGKSVDSSTGFIVA